MAHLNIGRKSGFIQRSGRMRRQTSWVGGVWTSDAIALNTAVLLTTFTAAALVDLVPFTIVRTRGLLFLASDQAAGTENAAVSYGHAVVTQQAVDVGVTAVPLPDDDSDSDLWYVWEALATRIHLSSAIGFNQVGVTRILDSKAMRKVEDGQNPISIVQTPLTGFSEGVVFRSVFRQLVKLH